jgi:hypothetical protein
MRLYIKKRHLLLPKGFFMKKHLYFILLIAASLFCAHITHTGNKPWYMVDIKNMNSTYYTKNCTKIGRIQSLRTIGTIAYNLITHDKKNPEKQLKEIEAQLKHFETKLLKKEHDALLAIKNKFQINQAQWNELLNTIETLKNTYKQGMQQEWPDVMHNVPEEIKTILYDLMAKNNINPYSVNLATDKQNPKDGTLAEASAKMRYSTDTPWKLINKYTPQKIKFFPGAINCSNKDKKANCAHELEHLIQHHLITKLALKTYLEHYNHLCDDQIETNSEYQELIKVQEQQADILSSIKDPDVASSMAHHRSKSPYPNYMYEKHYYNLTTIHMLWQLHAWVKYFHHGGIEKTTEEFKSTIEQSVSAFKNYCTQYLYT